jgi:hypothetical protein
MLRSLLEEKKYVLFFPLRWEVSCCGKEKMAQCLFLGLDFGESAGVLY